MQLQRLYKGEKEKDVYKREYKETMRPMTMRHIARALHTFGTQKHPLHDIWKK